MKILQQESERLRKKNENENPWIFQLEKAREEVKYFKQMYKLAKDKKASRIFILNSLLNQAFETAALGYLAAKNLNKTKEKNEFEMDCANFARVGEQLSKVAYGSTNNGWTQRKNDIDEWIETKLVSILLSLL